MKVTDANKFGAITGDSARIENKDGGAHTYSIEERTTFSKLINLYMKDDADLKDRIPMNVDDESLFHVFDNGVLMCKLIRDIDADAIDDRVINKQNSINIY
jgi:hypothetical protein